MFNGPVNERPIDKKSSSSSDSPSSPDIEKLRQQLEEEHPKQSDDIDNIGEYRIGEYPKLFEGLVLTPILQF